jgi:hypothetical protein
VRDCPRVGAIGGGRGGDEAKDWSIILCDASLTEDRRVFGKHDDDKSVPGVING